MSDSTVSIPTARPSWPSRKGGAVAMGGDGQVTLGNTVMKGNARKVRRLYNDKVLAGFAGGTADAFTLFERFEGKLEKYGNITRAAIELAKDWRSDRYLRRLEALLLVGDKEKLFVISGNGDVIEPEHDVAAIGSGGSFALSAARALTENTRARGEGHRREGAEHRRRHLHLHQSQSHPGRAQIMSAHELTPRQIVAELDKHIIGQDAAKRAVAIALRNRWRRMQVDEPLRQEITPKNILMIGPTGVGKTEIARRLAKLANAPFVKVEATKFTEVGYVGRDVDSIVKELVDVAVKITREQEMEKVRVRAADAAEERVLDALLPQPRRMGFSTDEPLQPRDGETRQKFRKMLREGQLDDREIEIELRAMPMGVEIMAPPGMEEMQQQLQSMFANLGGQDPHAQGQVKEAHKLLVDEEAAKLINEDELKVQAVQNAEQNGIVFIDEIDKVTRRQETIGADVSREGVQRDLLPLVEGSTVSTKYGPVKTDHVLFIASGAFSLSKPSDLIPELQGRLPIRVELDSLKVEDFVRILTEPDASLTTQYQALMDTEGVKVQFDESGVQRVAEIAYQVNERTENIGARRLHTVMERLLENVSYDATEQKGSTIVIDAKYVDDHLGNLVKDEDLSRYIL